MDDTDEPRPRPGSRFPRARRVPRMQREVDLQGVLRELERVGDSIETDSEQFGDLRGRPQVELAVRPPHTVLTVEGGAVADRCERVVLPVAGTDVIMNVAGSHN